MEPKYALRMLNDGEVRVTTLHTCRQYEDAALGDAGEGTRHRKAEHVTIPDLRAARGPTADFVRESLGRNARGRLKECAFIENTDVPDCYLYSTTYIFNEHVMRDHFGYRACVLIHDPRRFFARLTFALRDYVQCSRGGDGVVGVAAYASRAGDPKDVPDCDPVWLMPPRQSMQTEARCLWEPLARPIEPVNVFVGGIHEVCSAHVLPGLRLEAECEGMAAESRGRWSGIRQRPP
jgi:hypothetical protein